MKKLMVISMALAIGASIAYAEVLSQYVVAGPNSNHAATNVIAGITASDISYNGLIGYSRDQFGNLAIFEKGVWGIYSTSNSELTEDPGPESTVASRYFAFTTTADDGNTLKLSSLTFDWGGGVNNKTVTTTFGYRVFANIDGAGWISYGSDEIPLATYTSSIWTDFTSGYIDLSTAPETADGGKIEIRIQLFSSLADSSTLQAFKNVMISGTVILPPFTDTDGDGMDDDWERANGLIVGIDDSALDPDEDGLTNLQEFLLGTDPQNPDTDGDGLLDGVETGTGIYVSPVDTGTDPLMWDTDGDGYSDGYEIENGFDPNDVNNSPINFVSVAPDLSNINPVSAVGGTQWDDGFWRQRDGYGEANSTILESWSEMEDVPVLTQTLSGLVPGTVYKIFVNYTRFGASKEFPDGDRAGICGSLDNSIFTLFNGVGGTDGTVGFSQLTGYRIGDRLGIRGYLGNKEANEAGEIQVFVDDDGLAGTIKERVWFDGVSYETQLKSEINPATIISITRICNDVLKIIIDAPNAGKFYQLKSTDNLLTSVWAGVAHSVDGSAPWYVTNLSYVVEFESATNEVIYVQASDTVQFFSMEK